MDMLAGCVVVVQVFDSRFVCPWQRVRVWRRSVKG